MSSIQSTEVFRPFAFSGSCIDVILGTQGHKDTSLGLTTLQGDELPVSQDFGSDSSLYWFCDLTRSAESLTGAVKWDKISAYDTLTVTLGILANSEENQQRDQFHEGFEDTVTRWDERDSFRHATTLYLNGHKLELTIRLL